MLPDAEVPPISVSYIPDRLKKGTYKGCGMCIDGKPDKIKGIKFEE